MEEYNDARAWATIGTMADEDNLYSLGLIPKSMLDEIKAKDRAEMTAATEQKERETLLRLKAKYEEEKSQELPKSAVMPPPSGVGI